MEFIFALIALVSWSGSDLFSKKGTAQKDKYSHWRVIFWVGVVMGAHAILTIVLSAIFGESLLEAGPFIASLFYTDFVPFDFVKYLPVAFIYLLAMVIGYIGLRYIELSVSSPICNASGSLALVLIVILGALGVFTEPAELKIIDICAVVVITAGIIGLGFVEYRESDEIKALRSDGTQFKYTKSFIAILIPIIYLLLDAIATVGDEYLFTLRNCLECGQFIGTDTICSHCGFIFSEDLIEEGIGIILGDYNANTAFEFTSLCFALFAFIWVTFVKKGNMFKLTIEETIDGQTVEKTVPFSKNLIIGGTCETLGQIFYMAVVASDFVAGLPMISSYCVLSVVWSRIFLKEKLSFKHYIAIFLTLAGIVALGISEVL